MKRFLWLMLNSFLLANVSVPVFAQLPLMGKVFSRSSAEIAAQRALSPLSGIVENRVMNGTLTAGFLARIPSYTIHPDIPMEIQRISFQFQNGQLTGLGSQILQLPQSFYSLSFMRNEMVGLALQHKLSSHELDKAVLFYQERLQEAPKIFAMAKKTETLEAFSQRALEKEGEPSKIFGLFADATALSLVGGKQGMAALFDFYQASRKTIFETPAKILFERNTLRQSVPSAHAGKENITKGVPFGKLSSFERGLLSQGPFAGLAGDFSASATATWRALGSAGDFKWVDGVGQEQDYSGPLALNPSSVVFVDKSLPQQPETILAEILRLGEEEGRLANKPHGGNLSWKKYLSSMEIAIKGGYWTDADTAELHRFLQALKNLTDEPHVFKRLLIGREPYMPGQKINYMLSLEIENYLPSQAETELKAARIFWNMANKSRIFAIRTPQDYWNFEEIIEKAFPKGEWRIGSHETGIFRKEDFPVTPQTALVRSEKGEVHFHIHREIEENGTLKSYTFKMDLTDLQVGAKTLGEILSLEKLRSRMIGLRKAVDRFRTVSMDQLEPGEVENALREAESLRQEWTEMRNTLSNMIGKHSKDGKIAGLWQIEGLGEYTGVRGMDNLPKLLNEYIREFNTLLQREGSGVAQ